jgi:hypothetical protein
VEVREAGHVTKARGEAVGGRNLDSGFVTSSAGLGARIDKKRKEEDKGNAHKCSGNTYRVNVTLKAADGERQSDESMAMAGLSGKRMVETDSDSEEPSPRLRVDSGNRPEATTARVG